ncbi:MAG: type III-B CRISPR module-associated protein Cmr5 [Candidatus Diapherotrites archaeon]|nr:type III-B CRISPR module-associated protein Cmr5 [Candidatus Diapherotrites archaeon]
MQTIQQTFARQIYEQVNAFANANPGKDNPARKEYGAMAHKLPVLVRQAGLIQALAYVETRGKDPHRILLDHLAQTLGFTRDNFLQEARNAPLSRYMLLTRQALWALEWYKRFAQSILGVEPGNDGGA